MDRAILIFLISMAPIITMAKPLLLADSENAKNKYEKAIKSLAHAKSLKCFFPQGKFASWKGKKLSVLLRICRNFSGINFHPLKIKKKALENGFY